MVFSGSWGGLWRPCKQGGQGGSLSTPVEVAGQCAEWAVPVAGQRGEELLGHLHRCRLQPVADPAPLAGFGAHQPGPGQRE